MYRIACGALLLFASIAVAQQPGRPQLPPEATPPTFPQESSPRTPPDIPPPPQNPRAAAPQAQMPAAAEVAKQIQQKLATEPILQGSSVRVAVDDSTVTLTGAVDSEQEHQMALRIANSYAGDRNMVDKIKIRD